MFLSISKFVIAKGQETNTLFFDLGIRNASLVFDITA
jgi:hypothetical protein